MIEFKVEPIEYAQDLIVTVFGVKVCISLQDDNITVAVWPLNDVVPSEPLAETWVALAEIA